MFGFSFLFEYRISHSCPSKKSDVFISEINLFLRIGIAPNELQYRMYPTKSHLENGFVNTFSCVCTHIAGTFSVSVYQKVLSPKVYS
jgi:hypothetical protein